MKNLYFNSKSNNLFFGYILQVFLLLGIVSTTTAQLRVGFTQRTSQYTPDKKIYNVKGDFTIMGNTNLTLQNYGDQTQNGNNTMIYVDTDGNSSNGVDGKPTFNSSRSTLTFSTENNANPSCSNIIYAGLYWTGRSSDSNPSNNSFSVTKTISGTPVTKNFDKRNISLKGPNASSYTQFTASASDIYYPTTSDGYMYSAYKEVTDYVRANGIGEYTAADLALVEGNGGGTGFYGGWSLIVVYENSKMKYRDVTIFDGHAFVTSGTASFEIPVNGFNTVQSGPVGVKLGLMAGEGDNGISGDYFEIKKQSDNTFLRLSHPGNSTGNFFTSAIQTGGNPRTPSLVNNTGLDISMFNIPNTNNSVLNNNQSSTTFRYGSTQDTYVIFAIAMAVDAYIPEVENILTATSVNNVPVTTEPYVALPGQDVGFNIDIKNLGTEAINNYKVIVPIPYNAAYVPGSAVGTILFTPLPTPNTVTFDPTLGATGSIVWNMGTLPYPANPSTLLAKLTFKLKTTTDCSILLNPTCGSPIYVTGNSSGTGAITGTSFSGTRAIKGYTTNGTCVGQPILETLAIGINGTNYVAANCQNTPLIRNFGFCNSASTIGTSAIAANFPPGSTFYNEFPVTINSIQYSDVNPFPLVAGSTVTYYALPPNTTGCFFPFTISKCKVINAVDDSIGPITGTTGSTNAGNIFNDNGNGIDTLGGNQVLLTQVNLTILTPATPINGGPVPSIELATGNVVIPPGTPAGTYTIKYEICEKITPTNCDSAIVTICVCNAPISGGNQVVCKSNPIQTLTATASAPGQTIVWYNALTNGNIVASPTLSTVGTVTYYAQANVGSCSFPTRTAVTLTINDSPATPVSGGNQTQCAASPLQTLTATATVPAGSTLVWYDAAVNGNIVTNPTLNAVGSITYYAQAVNANTCASLSRTPVTLTINAAPVVPVTGGDQTQCATSPLQTLTATATVPAGSTVVWYDAAVNGNIVTNPTLNVVGSVTYYAQAVNANTCASLSRTTVTLTINAAPVVPVTGGDQTQCATSPLQTLTATATVPGGQTVVWYDAAVNGNIVTNPTINAVGSVTYYAQAVNANNCSSLSRTPVTLTINAAPAVPVTGGNQTQCATSPLQTLTATATVPAGSTVVWYDAAVNGNIVTNPTLNAVGSVTYYAQAVNANTCGSLSRTPVTLTINAAPVVPVTGGDQTECESSPLQTLIATATVPAGSTVVWYDAAVNGNIVTNPTLNAVGSVTYYAQAVNANTCGSLSRTPVTLTINAAPVVPVTGGDQTQCATSPLQTLTATATVPAGSTVVWYDAAVNGNIVTNPTLNVVGSVTYYAQAVNANTCASLSRTPVTLTINAAPVVPVTGGDQTECEASPLQTLTATATVPAGSTVVWYDAANGGNVLVSAPTLNAVGSITYYAQAVNANNCSSLSRTPVTLTINAAPVAPVTGGDQTECEASPLQTLTATATVPAGSTLVWYDAANGGNVLVTAPTLNAVGSITYYAQAVNANNCSSLSRTPVTLTINAAPVVPVTGGDQTECEASPLQTLTATATVPAGSTLVWYDAANGGNVLVTAPTLNAVGSITYYAQAVNANNCSSLSRTPVTLTINAAPVAPVTGGDQTECEASPLQTLTATATVPAGQAVVWYDAAIGGNVLVTAPTLNAVGSITYYAQAVNENNCSSLSRTPVTLTINAAPVVPVTGGDQTECEASPLQTLTATATVPVGSTVVWYDAANGGNVLVTAPTLNAVGSITYYAQAVNANNCASLSRTPVTLTINAAPVAPITGGDQTECEASPLQTLTATATVPAGSTVVWYDAANGGNVLVTAPTLNAVGSITYYAQAVNENNCSSLSRTPVTLTINAAPVVPVTGGDQTECEASPLQTLTATATVPVGSTVVWYDAAVNGNIVTNPTLNAVGSVTYYAQAVNANNCASLSRTPVTLTINAAPVAPVTGGDQTECEASPLQTLTATATVPVGSTVVWYDAATGGNVLVTAPTLNAVGSITYYAQAVNANNCSSLSRTPVTLTINAAPVVPVTGGDQTECEASPLQTLTATATVPAGQTVVWYDAATGGSIVSSPTLNAIGSITYYAAANGGTCISLDRTTVTLTINAAPVAPVTGGDQTECEASPLQTLTATATVPAGSTVVWYDAATGGNVLVTAPTLNAVGSITYYAQAVNENNCSSLSRTPVTLTINAAPVAPVTGGDQTECEASPLQTLTATATVPVGSTVVWYDAANGGNVLVTAPTLNAVGSITYYAQAVNANNCSSLSRTPVTLTINAAPVAPVTGGDQTECEASPLQTLTATATVPAGQAVVWYDAAIGGTIVTNPTLNAVGSITYYAQAVNENNCSSLSRTPVTLTINAAPVVPVTGGNQTECEASPLQTLTATATVPAGQAVVWYDAALGGSIVTTPTLNSVGTITYYAQALNIENCSSLSRTPVTLTINAAPVVPVSGGDQTECEASPLQTLTATATVPAGSTVVWYDAAIGGTIVTNPTLNAVGSITYYAQAVNENNCSSLSRTPVTLTINAAPVVPVTGGDQTECEASPLQTLTATATVPAGQAVVWYDAATGGSIVTNPTLNAVGSITYYAQAVNENNCSSLSRTPVTLTINAAPVAPITGGDQTECEASPLQTLTATATVPAGSTVVWYDAATGGNVLVTAPTLNAVGSITYYAQAVNANNCSSLSRTPVTLTINAAPVVPVTGGDQTECEASPLQTLTATATVPAGSTVVWYDAATGGNVLVTAPTLNAVGSITYYAQAVNANNCSSLSRTPVTLTINAAPVVPVTGGDQTECEASPLQTLTATATVPAGQAVVWYDAAIGGTIVTNPTLNAVGSITYYAQAVNENNCSSLSRTPVTLTINAAPVVPVTGGNQTECEASPLQTLTATATVPAGQAVVWYDAALGGSIVTTPTLNSVGTITYYAQALNIENCSSLSRTPVTLTINAAPVVPVSGGDQTECEASPLQTLTATATVPAGSTVVWYDAANGGSIVTNPTLNAVGSVTYYAQAVNGNTCASLSRTSVTLTIKPAVAVPLTSAVTNPTCTVATGSFLITNFNLNNTYNISPSTDVSISSTGVVTAPAGTYTITTSSNGCTSGPSIAVTINSQPQTPTIVIIGTVTQPTCAVATGSVELSGLPAGNWNINPGNMSGTSASTTISGLISGTYNFTVTNSSGCTSLASTSVIIDAQPTTPATPVIGTVTGPTCTVATGSVVLSDLPSGSWTINPGNITGNTATYTIADLVPGTYNYTVTNNTGCTSATSADVVIDEQPSNPTVVVNSAAANCNNDDEVSFDLNTFLPTGTPLTGSWSTDDASANGGLVGSDFSPYLIEVGTYLFNYQAIDDGGCAVKVELNMTVDDDCTVLAECTEPIVHNAFSPNGDNVNETFVIEQLDQFTCFPTNTVEIYNRWGILVYETSQYDNDTRAFKGISEGRVTVDKGAQLPTGTYFYILNYTTKEGVDKHKEGYLFLNQ